MNILLCFSKRRKKIASIDRNYNVKVARANPCRSCDYGLNASPKLSALRSIVRGITIEHARIDESVRSFNARRTCVETHWNLNPATLRNETLIVSREHRRSIDMNVFETCKILNLLKL